MKAEFLLINNRYLADHFNKDEYPMLFERVRSELKDYFNELSSNTANFSPDSDLSPCSDSASSFERDNAIRHDANAILEEVQANMDKYKFKFRRESVRANDQIVLSLFIAPAAASIGTPIALQFAEALTSAWSERFPENAMKVGDYDEIMEGFKWKITLTLK